jgi:signal transduction histidine kinase
MVNGLRGYLLTEEKSFIDSYDASNIENDSILKTLSPLLTDSSQSHLLNQIKELNDQWTEEYTEPLRQAKMIPGVDSGNLHAFTEVYKQRFATGKEKTIQHKLQQKFKAFTAYEYQIREMRRAKLSVSLKNTKRLSFILTAISLLAACLVIWFLVKKISGRIRQMTGMANAIAAGNYTINITDTGKDELSSLGHSLNSMADALSTNISLLERSNVELDQFAHIVSHDMKGPLRGISNVVTWIEEDHKDELTPKLKEYLALIKGRIVRAENLIEGILSYARVDKEKMEKESFDVHALVDEVLENTPNNGKVKVIVSPLPTLCTERLLLFQVFSNLIGNAIKYNDKPQGEVKIYCKEHLSAYEFFIEDNGIGIAQNYHDRIFIVFQTLRDRDSFESTGVGLAIVKKILDSRHERIKVVSEPGKGAIFSFTWNKN